MGLTVEQALTRIQKNRGVDRQGAEGFLGMLAKHGHPMADQIDNLDTFVNRPSAKKDTKSTFLDSVAASALAEAAAPFFGFAGLMGSEQAQEEAERLRGIRDQIFEDRPVAGTLGMFAGFPLPFKAATAPLKLGRVSERAAAVLARIPKPNRQALFSGKGANLVRAMENRVTEEGIETMVMPLFSRAGRIEKVVEPALAFSAFEGLSGGDPAQGLLIGGAFGLAGAGISKLWGRMRGRPEIDEAIRYIARARGESAEVTLERINTHGKFWEELGKANAPESVKQAAGRAAAEEAEGVARELNMTVTQSARGSKGVNFANRFPAGGPRKVSPYTEEVEATVEEYAKGAQKASQETTAEGFKKMLNQAVENRKSLIREEAERQAQLELMRDLPKASALSRRVRALGRTYKTGDTVDFVGKAHDKGQWGTIITNADRVAAFSPGEGFGKHRIQNALVVEVPEGLSDQSAIVAKLFDDKEAAELLLKWTDPLHVVDRVASQNALFEAIAKRSIKKGHNGIIVKARNPMNDTAYNFTPAKDRGFAATVTSDPRTKLGARYWKEQPTKAERKARGKAKVKRNTTTDVDMESENFKTRTSPRGYKRAQVRDGMFLDDDAAAMVQNYAAELGRTPTVPELRATGILPPGSTRRQYRDLIKRADHETARKDVEAQAKTFMDRMKSERGSIHLGPESPNPEAAANAAKDAEEVVLRDQYSRRTSMAALNPEWTFSKNILDMAAELEQGIKLFPRWRPTYDVSDNPQYLSFVAQMYKDATNILQVRMGERIKRGDEILKSFGIEKVGTDAKKFKELIGGLSRTYDGKGGFVMKQTLEGGEGKLGTAAREARALFDELYKEATGVDPKAHAIFDYFGIELNKEHVDLLIGSLAPGFGSSIKLSGSKNVVGLLNVRDALQKVGITEMLGGIRPWHKLQFPYKDGYFPIVAIRGERRLVLEQIERFTAEAADGKSMLAQYRLGKARNRLSALDLMMEEQSTFRLQKVNELRVGTEQSSSFLSSLDQKAKRGKRFSDAGIGEFDVIEDDNIVNVMQRYVTDLVSKTYHDKLIYDAQRLRGQITSPQLDEYIVELVNSQRGVRGFREDLLTSKFINSVTEKIARGMGRKDFVGTVTQRDIRDHANNIMQFQAISKLFFFPVRFPLLNGTQTALTVAPITGAGNWLASFPKAFSHAGMQEAVAAGVVQKDVSRFLLEIEGVAHVRNQWIKMIQKIPNFSEELNRSWAFHAAKDGAMKEIRATGKFTPHPAVRTFIADKKLYKSAEHMAEEYGRAVVDVTQFRFGPEGKPLLAVGGAARRLTFQFKTFTAGYASLLKNFVKYGKHDNYAAATKALTGLFFFGGLPAVAGGVTLSFYDEARREILESTGVVLPNDTGLAMVMDQFLDLVGDQPVAQGTVDLLKAIDITRSIEPFNIPDPTSLENIVQFAAGPTFGNLAISTQKWMKSGFDPVKGAKELVRGVSPFLAAAGNAAIEGRDGGLFTNSGQKVVERRPGQILARGLNLAPSIRSTRYLYLKDIEAALRGGQFHAIIQLIKEAREEGIIITPKDIDIRQGRVTRELMDKGSGRGFLADVFG